MTADDVAQALPDIPTLRNLCRSMAVLEAVLNPDGERYYTFSPHWSDSEEIASMRNGSGDEFGIVFSVYALRPLTLELIQRLNPDALVGGIVKEVGALGYPVNAALPHHAG